MEHLIIRYIHFLSIIILTAALFSEFILISPKMKNSLFKKVVKINTLYIISAILALFAGLALWLWVGKPPAFYTKNFLFHLKFTLFLVVFFLSIYPTLFFLKNKKSKEDIIIPKSIIILIRIELLILIVIPFLATLMAHGIGLKQ